MKLQGIFPPITTPFDHAGNIYAAKLQHNIEKWNLTTIAGYVVIGSTGESVMLTAPEKVELWEMVARYAAPGKLLLAGTGVKSAREPVCPRNGGAKLASRPARVNTPHFKKTFLN